MKLTAFTIIASVSGLAVLGACMDPDGTYNNTASGALIGSAGGAAIGALIADDERKGAAIGALVGGAAGAAIGYNLEQQEAELRNQIGGSGAIITNLGDRLVVTLPEGITFDTDSATVKASLYGPLQSVANSLQQYPASIIQVVGHTDSVGDAAYNQSLSERRAGSIASVLIGDGVSSNRIRTVGMGERQPIASNDTPAGRQQNRRVDINIIPTQ